MFKRVIIGAFSLWSNRLHERDRTDINLGQFLDFLADHDQAKEIFCNLFTCPEVITAITVTIYALEEILSDPSLKEMAEISSCTEQAIKDRILTAILSSPAFFCAFGKQSK